MFPTNYKPLKNLGKGISGVYEIRVRNNGNIYRTAYVTKIGDDIVILHCWQERHRQHQNQTRIL